MLLPHARTLGLARTAVAALSDHAVTVEASSAYEHVLIALDRLHRDDCPPLGAAGLTDDPFALLAAASSAIEELVAYGVDELEVELILAELEQARALDGA
ncbi:MAG: hypothetical protein KDB63_00945 [Nocardioidaceae bacterium]|nr:hypothetical protein [Nocardioidaceae bacterium]